MVSVICVYIFAGYTSLHLASIIKSRPRRPKFKAATIQLIVLGVCRDNSVFIMNLQVKFISQTLKIMFSPLPFPATHTGRELHLGVLNLLCAFPPSTSRLQLCASSAGATERQRRKRPKCGKLSADPKDYEARY